MMEEMSLEMGDQTHEQQKLDGLDQLEDLQYQVNEMIIEEMERYQILVSQVHIEMMAIMMILMVEIPHEQLKQDGYDQEVD